MEIDQVISYVAYLLPAILVGIVAYYFFRGHTANEEGRRRYLIHQETKNKTIPLRLQAYERLTLFLERIDPNRLLTRVKPISKDLDAYENLLINNIEQEFDHNISQQIYVSQECWNLINAAKNATIHIIRQGVMHEKDSSPDNLRQYLLSSFMEDVTPSQKALAYIRKEVSELF